MSDKPQSDQPQSEEPKSFRSEDWQVTIGLRAMEGNKGVHFGVEGDPSIYVPVDGNPLQSAPDLNNRAVHFALWLQHNFSALLSLSEVEYTQRLNLLMIQQRTSLELRMQPANDTPPAQLVSANGTPLQ